MAKIKYQSDYPAYKPEGSLMAYRNHLERAYMLGKRDALAGRRVDPSRFTSRTLRALYLQGYGDFEMDRRAVA